MAVRKSTSIRIGRIDLTMIIKMANWVKKTRAMMTPKTTRKMIARMIIIKATTRRMKVRMIMMRKTTRRIPLIIKTTTRRTMIAKLTKNPRTMMMIRPMVVKMIVAMIMMTSTIATTPYIALNSIYTHHTKGIHFSTRTTQITRIQAGMKMTTNIMFQGTTLGT